MLLHFIWFCWLAEAPRCRAAHSGREVVSGVVCPCIAHTLYLPEVSSKSRAVQEWCLCCTWLWAEHSRLQQTPGFDNLLGIRGQVPIFTWGDQNPAQSSTPGAMSTNLQFCIWIQQFYRKMCLPQIKNSVWPIYSTGIKIQAWMSMVLCSCTWRRRGDSLQVCACNYHRPVLLAHPHFFVPLSTF